MSTYISSKEPSRLREGRESCERGGLGGPLSARRPTLCVGARRDSPSGEYLNNPILTGRFLRFLAIASGFQSECFRRQRGYKAQGPTR